MNPIETPALSTGDDVTLVAACNNSGGSLSPGWWSYLVQYMETTRQQEMIDALAWLAEWVRAHQVGG